MNNKEYQNILRGLRTLDNTCQSNISDENLLIVKSFLLILRKRYLLLSPNKWLDTKNYNLLISSCVENSNHPLIKSIYLDHIQVMIFSVRNTYLQALYSIYFKISDEIIESHTKDLFDMVVVSGLRKRYNIQSDSLQPKELTSLINHFCDFEKAGTYYNPFAGLASLSLNLPTHFKYVGEELNQTIYLIGSLRMMAYDPAADIKYYSSNSIRNLATPESAQIKFDFIGFNPPLNLKLDGEMEVNASSEYSNSGNANSFIISKCFNKLKSNGKMAFLMSNGFLFSSMSKDVNLKKLLTKNGHIEKIVALPKKIFSFTGIAVNLIVINKSSNEDQQVEFIDASEKFTLKDKKTRVLDVKGIFVLLSEENSNLKKSISFQEIVKNRYNLSVNRYVFDELNLLSEENQSLVALNNFVSQLPRTSIRPSNDIRVVRTRDLSDNSLKSIKSFEDVEKRKPNQRVSLLEDNALLLATTWKSLKPTLYRKRDEDIYYEPNLIFALSVDESKIDLDYLILELKKDYVQKQLERKSVGTGIMRINRRDLLQIKIVVPNRNEQEKRKLNFKQSIILEQQQKLESLKEELGINIADENSFLRHKISGTLNNVRGSFNKLKEIIDNQVSKELPEVYSYKAKPTYTANLRDYLNRLNRDINSIHRAVQTVGKELSIREMKFKTFNLIKFIEDYVEEVKNRPNTNYEIWFENDYEALNDNKVKEVNVTGDPDFLYQAFDNIIQNAERHAFSKDDEEEIVEISLFYNFESSEVELHFCNTGNPLPENFSLENFIRKGSKSGTNSGKGIGGWLINEVMKAHEAKLDIIDESEQGTEYAGSMFPTRIKLTFPMEFKI